jgi:glycosyltransferase involved in cell wall biosynthesis
MRVLIFTQHFWPESFRINDVAQSLQQAGHEVSVLTGQPNYPSGRVFEGYRAAATGIDQFGAIPVYRVPLVPRGNGHALRLISNYLSFILSAVLFGAWRLRGQRFDVIFVYASSPLLQAIGAIALARLKGCAVVTWVQDLWPQSLQATGYVQSPRVLAAVSAVVRWIYARQQMLLVQSPGFVEPVRQLSPRGLDIRVHANPAESIDDAVEAAVTPTNGATSAPADLAPLALPAGFNIVFAGNLGTAQALDSVLDAAEQLCQQPGFEAVRFVLVGSGQRSAWLAEQVQQRSLHNVLLPGRFAPAQMPAILAQAQALLVSLADDPALALTVPSKVQSYLAAGKPILAALAGEGAQVVAQAGAGVACKPADAQALVAAVSQLFALPQAERRQMGEAGRRYFEAHFSAQRLTPALAAHLQDAVDLYRAQRSRGRTQ